MEEDRGKNEKVVSHTEKGGAEELQRSYVNIEHIAMEMALTLSETSLLVTEDQGTNKKRNSCSIIFCQSPWTKYPKNSKK